MFQSTLLNGTYPDTTNYIPKDFEYMINLNLKEYYDAIDRASIITLSKDKNIVKMNIDDKKMTIYGSSAESGKTKEELIIESNNKNKLDISFSSKYMMDALKVLNDEELVNQDFASEAESEFTVEYRFIIDNGIPTIYTAVAGGGIRFGFEGDSNVAIVEVVKVV